MTSTPVTVRFINHACVQVETARSSLLIDPWFSGAIFNNSWRLLRDTDPATLDLSKLRYLWISHEHPDHFHFPTLRTIRKIVAGPLTVFFQRVADKSVRDALVKLGYAVVELDDGRPSEADPGLTLTCFRAMGGDSALLIDAEGVLIADTNDCGLTARHLDRIKAACGNRPLDLLFTQFGLAGYYANADDAAGLARAREFHLDQLRQYVAALAPKVTVPFASFVRFCRPSNAYLNDAQVKLRDLITSPPPTGEYRIPVPGSELWPRRHVLSMFPSPEENELGVRFWERTIAEANSAPLIPDPVGDPAEIEKHGREFVAELPRTYFRRRLADTTVVYLTDIERAAIFDWKGRQFRLDTADAPPPGAVGELSSGDFLFMLKFPYGADTLNVSAAFRVHDLEHWSWLIWTRNAMYTIRKAPWPTRAWNRALLALSRAASWFGIDLTNGRAWPWRALDRLRRRR